MRTLRTLRQFKLTEDYFDATNARGRQRPWAVLVSRRQAAGPVAPSALLMTNANTRLDGLLSFAGDDGGGLMPPRRPVGRHASPGCDTAPAATATITMATACCALLQLAWPKVRSGREAGPVAAPCGSPARRPRSAHDTAHKAERGRRATLPSSVFGALAAVSVAAQIVAAAAAPAAAAAAVPVAAAAAPCSLIGLGELRTAIFAKLELRPRHALVYLVDGGIHLHDAVRVTISAKLAEWLCKEAPFARAGCCERARHAAPRAATPRRGTRGGGGGRRAG